ncbi:alpha-galactosidase [Naasia sp. SYSU D00948]|uniref:alpha-galactosidase n=1 Tax=Naasia sp. SYSU D00948 TaxID=2817379 RepID=UPI001B317323|nr:alpha-galactosidase [Naasia sp. SYSU D00948]
MPPTSPQLLPDDAETLDVSVPVHLTAAGVSLVIDPSAAVPRILYWGREGEFARDDLLALRQDAEGIRITEGVTAPLAASVLGLPSAGWVGAPGLEGHREGTRFSPLFELAEAGLHALPTGAAVRTAGVDSDAGLRLEITIALLESGLVRLEAELTSIATGTYDLEGMRLSLPVPTEAQEVLDFAGRHLRERSPQRSPFLVGSHLREGRRGRTGSDATPVLAAGETGFGFGGGEVWTIHTAWSGNHTTSADLGLGGVRVLSGGELLLPGEVRLAEGESYRTPYVYGSYGSGLDEAAQRFHRHLRSKPGAPASSRPVVLNTWEAVYFRQDLASLVALAERGARVGAERFVLDDGWFRGRRNDRAGLGDWQVDAGVWPDGLGPLVEKVRALGMDFGLWFEPEMVNEDSDLARAHPEWILAPGERLPLPGRNQQVLNVANPEAYRYLLESMSELIERYSIDYLKWDHNRDLLEPGDRVTGRPGVHRQTRAVYALIDELRARHPGIEIESCSSGGGRVDLGILERTDRVWASDCIDALERQQIQRWTGQLLPPEYVGSHVGSPVAHTTKRRHTLAFRAATALFGHFGIEWDLRDASDEELEELAAWVELYKSERALLHSGRTWRADHPDPAYWVHGVVSESADRALFAFVATGTGVAAHPGKVRLPGLRDDQRYRLEAVDLCRESLMKGGAGQPGWTASPQWLHGGTLTRAGTQAPRLYPEQAFLLRLVADDPS